MRLFTAFLLCVSLAVVGCGTKTPQAESGDTGDAGDTFAPEDSTQTPDRIPVSTRWANEDAVLADAPDTELVPQEIEWLNQEAFVIDLPQNGTVDAQRDTIQCKLPSGATMEIKVNTLDLPKLQDNIRRFFVPKEFTFVGSKMLIYEKDDGSFDAVAQFSDGVRDFGVTISNNNSLPDCLTLLKSAKSLRPKEPYPENPVDVLSRIGVRFKPKTDDPLEVVSLTFIYGATCARQLALVEHFPNLESLYMELTFFQSLEPLLKLPKLTKFETKSVLAESEMETLAQIGTLRHLQTNAGGATESWFKTLGKMTELTSLKLDNIGKDTFAIGMRHLAQCQKLNDVTLLDFFFENEDRTAFEEALEVLSRLPNLQKLTLRSISDPVCRVVGSLESLESFTVDSFSGITDEQFELIAASPSLKSLTIDGGLFPMELPFTSQGLNHLGEAKSLQSLSLMNLPLKDDHWAAIAKLPNLKVLSLMKTSLTGKTLMEFKDAPALEELQIHYHENLNRKDVDKFKDAAPNIKVSY